MAKVAHKYDHYNRKEPAIIYLAKPGKRLYCALNGVDASSCSLTLRTNNTVELSFSVDKYIDGELSNGFDDIEEYMELYCAGIWFRICEPPSISFDGLRMIKEVTAESYEVMLTQYKLKEFEINTGSESSYEMMYQEEHDKNKFYQVKFYYPDEPKLSLLHIILSHADVPGWKIGYVDNITPDEENVLLPNAICNFEVDEKNVYAFLTQDVASAYKCIFEFDTVNMLINVYRVESLGKDTNITLGFRNIQDSVTISRDDSLVTQFYVDGLGKFNIDSVNFMDSVISDISYFVKEPYMNKVLQDKYNAWINYRESRREEFIRLSKEYNKALDVMSELENRVPIDTAVNDWFSASVEDLKSAYNDNSAIIKGLESTYVDEEGHFDLEALKKSHDWSLYESIMNYTLPSIVAALQSKDEKVEGFGKGNIISNVNPVSLGDEWLTIGANGATIEPYQLTDSPAWGITRGVKITITEASNAGMFQKSITTENSQEYVLSCYVKGSGTVNLEYALAGQDRQSKEFSATSNWTRIFTTFNAPGKLLDIAFTGNATFSICGMQLEMGIAPSQFGYFTQDEKVLKAYETDWKLYGIKELKIKIKTYENCISELKKNGYADPYSSLSSYKEDYHTQMHQKYLDYIKLKEEAEAALKERQAEYDAAFPEEVKKKRKQIATDVLLESFGTVQEEFPAFTAEETFIIKSLYNQAIYTNENIIVTSLDDLTDSVDKQLQLYKDAVEQLFVESHPQYTYSDSINNIYALPEFKEFHDDLEVNNFIRLGVTDSYYVKLRVIEIVYNPCALDESMEVTFSNMVQYKSKRNDYNSLLDEAINKAVRNGGRVDSVDKSNTTDYVITADFIKKIFSNPLFNSMLGGSTVGGAGSGGTSGGSGGSGGTGGTITAETIIAELIKADEAIIGKLTVDTAFMKYLDAKLISADKIVTNILNAEKANIEQLSAKLIDASKLSADVAQIKKLFVDQAGIENLSVLHLTASNVTIDDAVIKELIAAKISVGDLDTYSATAKEIVLISSNGNKSIAFKNATQQFYDSKGNVRVQIGQDGNGEFNFIVRGADGTTALFDSTGIKKDGIPDNTIINEMISDKAIDKRNLNFTMVEPNEHGGVDINQIWNGGEKFGSQYTSFKKETNDRLDELASNTKRIELYADSQVFIDDGGIVTPSIIKVYSLTKGGAKVEHWYIDNVEQTQYVAEDKSYINIPSSYLNEHRNSITIKATDSSGAIYDVMSLYYIVSGSEAITVTIASSNGNIFKTSEGVLSTTLTCTVYKGSEAIVPGWYKWLKKDGNSWIEVGKEQSIIVSVTTMGNIENYKCQVDV